MLAQDMFDVHLDDNQFLGDLTIAAPIGKQPGHLSLASGEHACLSIGCGSDALQQAIRTIERWPHTHLLAIAPALL